MEFLETARQEKQCRAVFARVGVGTQRNKESQAAQASVAHCLGSGASPHRMADENFHRSDRTCDPFQRGRILREGE